jgi:hypothetical protein
MFLMVQAPAGCPPHPSFVPRRTFSLSLRRAFQVGARAAPLPQLIARPHP